MPSATLITAMKARVTNILPHRSTKSAGQDPDVSKGLEAGYLERVEHVEFVFEYDAERKRAKSALKTALLRKAKKVGWADHQNSNYNAKPSNLTANRLEKRYTVKLVPEEHLEKEVRDTLEREVEIDVAMQDVRCLLRCGVKVLRYGLWDNGDWELEMSWYGKGTRFMNRAIGRWHSKHRSYTGINAASQSFEYTYGCYVMVFCA